MITELSLDDKEAHEIGVDIAEFLRLSTNADGRVFTTSGRKSLAGLAQCVVEIIIKNRNKENQK